MRCSRCLFDLFIVVLLCVRCLLAAGCQLAARCLLWAHRMHAENKTKYERNRKQHSWSLKKCENSDYVCSCCVCEREKESSYSFLLPPLLFFSKLLLMKTTQRNLGFPSLTSSSAFVRYTHKKDIMLSVSHTKWVNECIFICAENEFFIIPVLQRDVQRQCV